MRQTFRVVMWCVYCVRRWASPFRRGGEASSFQTEILIRTAFIFVGNHNWCDYMSMYCVFAQLNVFRVCVLCCICVPRPPPRLCLWLSGPRWSGRGAVDARVASRGWGWSERPCLPIRRAARCPVSIPRKHLDQTAVYFVMFARASLCVEWVSRDARGR